jgi:hypothetical protein
MISKKCKNVKNKKVSMRLISFIRVGTIEMKTTFQSHKNVTLISIVWVGTIKMKMTFQSHQNVILISIVRVRMIEMKTDFRSHKKTSKTYNSLRSAFSSSSGSIGLDGLFRGTTASDNWYTPDSVATLSASYVATSSTMMTRVPPVVLSCSSVDSSGSLSTATTGCSNSVEATSAVGSTLVATVEILFDSTATDCFLPSDIGSNDVHQHGGHGNLNRFFFSSPVVTETFGTSVAFPCVPQQPVGSLIPRRPWMSVVPLSPQCPCSLRPRWWKWQP